MNRSPRRPESSLLNSGTSDLARWRDGIALPLLLALYGAYSLVFGKLILPTRGRWAALEGPPARAAGLAALAFAAFLHVNAFWWTSPTLGPLAAPVKAVAALTTAGALATLIYLLVT